MKVIFATSLALAAGKSTEESLSASVASAWGDYMSNWVQSQDGKYVSSEAQPGSTECWDLAEAAVEHARKAGYSIPKQPSSYQWSSQTVSYTNAQPGDILQFASYSEKVTNSDGSWSSKSTGTHHTAVVTRAFDSSSCGIRVEEQNPKPAHSSIYHPCDQYRTGGTVVVYRLATSLSASMPLKASQCDTVCRDVCNQPFTAGGPDCCAACGCPGEDCSEDDREASLSASVASAWGDYMSNWVQSQDGKYVSSEAQPGSTECWDLAEAAIEHARKAGYSIPKQPSSYQWSSQTVSYTNVQPGDILQFASYSEKVTNSDGSWSSKSTGTHHTAVVTRAFDSSSCGIRVEEQNPKPAHSSIYHPCDQYRTGGTVVAYRLSSGFALGSKAVSEDDWEAYKQEFGKAYNSNGEDEYRHGIFKDNLAKYAALNAQEPLAHYGPTIFTDMTPDEYLNGYVPSTVELPELAVDTSLQATPVDWTGKYTTDIKDQGSCGSCWAESAISQVESDAMREHGWTGVLSVQELVDCTTAGQGSQRFGCDGGTPTKGYDVIMSVGGVASGYDYKYTARDGTCKIDDFTKYVQINSYKSVGRLDEAVMKSYVSSTGPLSVCVDANDWGGYRNGIKTSCGRSIDHCVQIVGWGTQDGTDYWKVRNSWGSTWGESGHMRLKIGADLCRISNQPSATSTSIIGPAPAPSPTTCTDMAGWLSSEGDPCSLFELNSYCTADGREGDGWNTCSWGPITDYANSKGMSALDACCACGGGSNPTPTPAPAPTPPSTCSDLSNWRDSEGSTCCDYSFNKYCTASGGEGEGWNHDGWGRISDYANSKGISGLDACCACGGGSSGSQSITV